jgi:peptide-methionine (S)-S-oxide reductase
MKPSSQSSTETALFGAGCFWGVEETFRVAAGVTETEVGYAGGKREHPTYEQVCSDATGHAEVVRVTFDPSVISYEKLLDIFFSSHNPTTRDRQGPDIGSQYRSVIFFTSSAQEKEARAKIATLEKSGRWLKQPRRSGPPKTTIKNIY